MMSPEQFLDTDYNYLNNKYEPNIIAYNNLVSLIENVPDFIQQWSLIDETWNKLGYVKHTDNTEKTDDYIYINNCFCNFVFSHQEQIKKNIDNLEYLKNYIIKLCNKKTYPTKKEGWSPRFVVYLTLKNSWLVSMAELIKVLIDYAEEDNKEE